MCENNNSSNEVINSANETPQPQQGLIKKSWVFVKKYWKYSIEFLSQIGIIIAVVAFFMDMNDRSQDRLLRAWEIVYTSAGKGGSGMLESLEFLNSKHQDFHNLDLSGAVLDGINLEGAKLYGMNFEKTSLRNANIKNTDLRFSKLGYADLSGADLSKADLRFTDFTGVPSNKWKEWEGLSMKGANIYRANMDRDFKKWAMDNGAVEIEFDEKWPKTNDPASKARAA